MGGNLKRGRLQRSFDLLKSYGLRALSTNRKTQTQHLRFDVFDKLRSDLKFLNIFEKNHRILIVTLVKQALTI